MILTVTSESTIEPVTLNEFKTFVRMESTDSTAEDSLMKAYITGARRLAENLTKRDLVTKTRKLYIDIFENTTQVIELPRPPLSTVSTNVVITYVKDNTAGDTTTIGTTVFTVDSDSEPGRVYPTYNNDWPTDVRDQPKAIDIQYVSGYSSLNVIPAPIKTWIQLKAAGMYENRDPLTEESLNLIDRSFFDGFLDPYLFHTIST